ncbi:Na(+)/H(+) antiporter subunit A, partial [Listeria seeligeri FSL S4-171]
MMLGGFILLHVMSDSYSIRAIIHDADVLSQSSLFILENIKSWLRENEELIR